MFCYRQNKTILLCYIVYVQVEVETFTINLLGQRLFSCIKIFKEIFFCDNKDSIIGKNLNKTKYFSMQKKILPKAVCK
jgi:hypothetical protein